MNNNNCGCPEDNSYNPKICTSYVEPPCEKFNLSSANTEHPLGYEDVSNVALDVRKISAYKEHLEFVNSPKLLSNIVGHTVLRLSSKFLATVSNLFKGRNVGNGAQVYKSSTTVNGNTHQDFRTIVTTQSITATQNPDNIALTVNPVWLGTQVPTVDYPVIDGKSVGNGFSIYAGLSNKKIQQKSLKEGSGIKISATDSEILIEAVQPGFGYIKNYYVNSNYTPTADSPADGSIIRPFPTFDEAYDEIIGTGTYYNPQNKNAKIIIQTDSYTAINPSINKTTYHFENNKALTYTGVDDYMFDTERIYPNLLDSNNKLTEEVIMVITGVGTITRTLGVGLVRGVASNRTGTETINDFTSKIIIAPNETDFITLWERNSYPSNTWAGDITNISNVPLSQIYGGEFKYSTTLVPTLPLIHCEGAGKAPFSWGVTSGAGTVKCIVLVNTALKIVENPLSTGVIYNGNRFIIETDGRHLATTSGTKVSGKSYYEPKSGTSYIDAEGNLRVDKVEMFANNNFSHGSVDKGFVFRGNASFVKGNMNFSGGVYFKTFVDYTNSNLNYFAFANTSEGANITLVNVGLLINLANNNPFTFIIPNTLFQYSPTSIVTDPSTPITLETYGTHASFIKNPAISGIKSFEDDETAKANNLFKNNIYYNTTSSSLQFVN